MSPFKIYPLTVLIVMTYIVFPLLISVQGLSIDWAMNSEVVPLLVASGILIVVGLIFSPCVKPAMNYWFVRGMFWKRKGQNILREVETVDSGRKYGVDFWIYKRGDSYVRVSNLGEFFIVSGRWSEGGREFRGWDTDLLRKKGQLKDYNKNDLKRLSSTTYPFITDTDRLNYEVWRSFQIQDRQARRDAKAKAILEEQKLRDRRSRDDARSSIAEISNLLNEKGEADSEERARLRRAHHEILEKMQKAGIDTEAFDLTMKAS